MLEYSSCIIDLKVKKIVANLIRNKKKHAVNFVFDKSIEKK
jgi:hypothetical protein